MPLRCLLFSSDEEMVQPIWQVLTELGIEGEYCRSAVDAVERVTTQLFQIVITDWDDQPEASFLLKTARDQKASQRPLTLAIVRDDAKLPEALQAGANSILLRPIQPEQVRDTMNTACDLLRSKRPAPVHPPAEAAPQSSVQSPVQPPVKETAVLAAAAAAGAVQIPVQIPAPPSVPQESEKTFRAGEFLQSPSSRPGAQFDTECEVQKSLNQVAASEVDALTELEPMASAVETAPPPPAEPQKALDGWASLQARLTKSAPAASPPPESSRSNELLSYGETPSVGSQPAAPGGDSGSSLTESPQESATEAALFSYISGESKEAAESVAEAHPQRIKIALVSALALACVVLVALPRTRARLAAISRKTAYAGRNWLNPLPVQVPPTVTQHETFGQDSEEFKFPITANIPDATTDPSQIRVLPVVDPTAKPVKGSEAAAAATTPAPDTPTDQSQNASIPNGPNGQPQVLESPINQQAGPNPANVAGSATIAVPVEEPTGQPPANPSLPQEAPPPQPRPITIPSQGSAPQHSNPVGTNPGIPSSLRSQTASMTPDASGAKPMEAAMSSFEPVSLPALVVLDLLAQPVDPVYPDAAKAGGQHGSVVLQVLIGRDGTVQDAKFLQGSLVFARAAIDAVKQWRFKPYTMNGRAVSVQSTITLSFKPPA
jgi:TonB family protein